MITLRKSTHGFPFLSYMSMALGLVAFLGCWGSAVINHLLKIIFLESIDTFGIKGKYSHVSDVKWLTVLEAPRNR